MEKQKVVGLYIDKVTLLRCKGLDMLLIDTGKKHPSPVADEETVILKLPVKRGFGEQYLRLLGGLKADEVIEL